MSEATAGSTRSTTVRPRAQVPGRRRLLGAVAMVAVGSFLPWLDTVAGTVLGAQGAGVWTFYAAMLGLAGALVPVRTLRLVQAVILGVVAIALPVWQIVHLFNLVGASGWMPGPGIVLVIGGGVLALDAARRIHRDS